MRRGATPTVSTGRLVLGAARPGQLGGELDGEARLDGRRADRQEHRHGVDVEDVDRAHRDVGPTAQAGRRQRGVDRAGRQDRRDRQAVHRPGAIGDQEDRRPARASARPRRARAGRGPRSARPARPPRPTSRRGPGSWHPRSRTPTSRPSRSATIGRWRRAVRGARGMPPSRAGRRPSSTRRSMTIRSRSGSIAGLVTWAKAWRRWSATGRSTPGATGRRRVVAHAPQRLVRLERHRLDVEPWPARHRARPGAEARAACARPWRRDRGLEAILVDRARRVVDRQAGGGRGAWRRRPRGSRDGPARRGAADPARAGRGGRSRPR